MPVGVNKGALDTIGRGKLVLSLLVLAGVMFVEVLSVIVVIKLGISLDSLWGSIIPEASGAVAAVIGMVIMGGKSWAGTSRHDLAVTLRFGWWCLAISVGLMGWELVSYMTEGTAVAADWPIRLAQCLIYCLAIGVLEEFMFRGLLMGGMLAAFGGTHRGVVCTVMCISLFFGLAHVDLSTDFVDVLTSAQAVLKIIQTGMYSILLCVIVLRTKRLGGVSIFHGLDDFLLIAPGIALFKEPIDVEYVVEGEEGLYSIVFYLVVIALYLPFTIKALRELHRGQDICRGPFMEKELARIQMTVSPEMPCAPEQPSVAGAKPPVPLGFIDGHTSAVCSGPFLQDSEQMRVNAPFPDGSCENGERSFVPTQGEVGR